MKGLTENPAGPSP